jgi:hypothetical protein
MASWGKFAIVLILAVIVRVREIRVGTVIPIMLSSSLNASKDVAGKKIQGRVMQKVSLPDGGSISERSQVFGHIVRVTKPGESGSSIVVAFDTIKDHGRTIPISAAVLAVASAGNVSEAQTPISLNSESLPATQWATRQVGGDVVRRDYGKVASAAGVSGTWLEGTSVSIRLTANPAAGCPEGPGYDREQAVWIFSSAACGGYGLGDLKISNPEGSKPAEVTLTSRRDISIGGGSGWLLIAVAETGQ